MGEPHSTTKKSPEEWTLSGFLDEFMRVDEFMTDRSYCFVLGAGASVTSEIPAASDLARSNGAI